MLDFSADLVAPLRAPPAPPAADDRGYLAAKRAIDIVGATLGIILCLPVALVIALAIRIDSGGPVLYRQERVGARRRRRDGVKRWELATFRIVKFRTMVNDADDDPTHRDFVRDFVAGRTEQTDDEAPFKLSNDPRITRVGRLLRATSLDELPQLLNVLAGTMSLVGPRPVPVYEVETYRAHHLLRLAGPPGITGPWQVDGRGVATFEEMVRMDIQYLRAQSLSLDLRLLVRTIPSALLSRKGAR